MHRAIFTFASHLADDRKAPHFWRTWEEFEGRHGNAMTWREMTRIHRSVAASFSSVHFNTTNVEAAVPVFGDSDPMAALEAAAAAKATQGVTGFVSAGVQGGAITEVNSAAGVAANPEEIDIGDDDDE
jgi:pre-mRNA-splicing factor SYF1